jgi:hypothetical protein
MPRRSPDPTPTGWSTALTGDPLARLGGDEFGLVASLGLADARRLVDRLQVVLLDAGISC